MAVGALILSLWGSASWRESGWAKCYISAQNIIVAGYIHTCLLFIGLMECTAVILSCCKKITKIASELFIYLLSCSPLTRCLYLFTESHRVGMCDRISDVFVICVFLIWPLHPSMASWNNKAALLPPTGVYMQQRSSACAETFRNKQKKS